MKCTINGVDFRSLERGCNVLGINYNQTYKAWVEKDKPNKLKLRLGKTRKRYKFVFKPKKIIPKDVCGFCDGKPITNCVICGVKLCSDCKINSNGYQEFLDDYCENCIPVFDDGSREREDQQDWR